MEEEEDTEERFHRPVVPRVGDKKEGREREKERLQRVHRVGYRRSGGDRFRSWSGRFDSTLGDGRAKRERDAVAHAREKERRNMGAVAATAT